MSGRFVRRPARAVLLCGFFIALAAGCAREERGPFVEATNWSVITCTTGAAVAGSSIKPIHCSGSVSLSAFNFPAGTHFVRTEGSLGSNVGGYGGMGMNLYGEGSGFSGNNGVTIGLELDGHVEKVLDCADGVDPEGLVRVVAMEDLGDGVEGMHSHSPEGVSVSLSCN